ncbi:transglycosylase [Asticcacaulis machinosus]|uniref:Transglycosylase n=1 Tax=Asticcacaulis machinosus TaxID=2984211 RepID=A0ABT5HF55_9CAUL|nr:transglycosylase [Asticcacaulis machinosus]MDC7674770.1 transglycosylase [Asticcacaulis machinosus]
MRAEDWLVAVTTGFVVSWIANALTKSRYSFMINLFVGIFGSILVNMLIHTMSIYPDSGYLTLKLGLAGSAGLLILFHISRRLERR